MVIGLDGNEANVKNRVGSGTYAFELIKQFSVSKHHFIVYLKDSPLSDLPKETENFKYKVFGPKKLWTQFALPVRLTFGDKPDVFFSMGHYGPRFSKVPYVITIHDLSYLHYPHLFIKNDLYQLKNWTKYSVKNSAHIIAVSQTTKDDIVKSYGVSPSKITVTYEGYDHKRFNPRAKTRSDLVLEKYSIKGDYIIFVGTLQPRKNVAALIEAFQKLIEDTHYFDLKLVIAGKKGWLFQPIFEKAKFLNIGKAVIFTDFVPDDDLSGLIAGAKVYVLPSLWEGFGIPVIEAQACGVPVVVSNTSSLPEIVGESAVLVDPENIDLITKGIQKALDPKTRSDLVKKGFENIKRFSWEKCAKESLIVLQKIASK